MSRVPIQPGLVAERIARLRAITLRNSDPSLFSHSPDPPSPLPPSTTTFLSRPSSPTPSSSPSPSHGPGLIHYISNNSLTPGFLRPRGGALAVINQTPLDGSTSPSPSLPASPASRAAIPPLNITKMPREPAFYSTPALLEPAPRRLSSGMAAQIEGRVHEAPASPSPGPSQASRTSSVTPMTTDDRASDGATAATPNGDTEDDGWTTTENPTGANSAASLARVGTQVHGARPQAADQQAPTVAKRGARSLAGAAGGGQARGAFATRLKSRFSSLTRSATAGDREEAKGETGAGLGGKETKAETAGEPEAKKGHGQGHSHVRLPSFRLWARAARDSEAVESDGDTATETERGGARSKGRPGEKGREAGRGKGREKGGTARRSSHGSATASLQEKGGKGRRDSHGVSGKMGGKAGGGGGRGDMEVVYSSPRVELRQCALRHDEVEIRDDGGNCVLLFSIAAGLRRDAVSMQVAHAPRKGRYRRCEACDGMP